MPGLKGPAGRPARLSRRWRAQVGDHVIDLAWSPCGARLAAAAVGGPVHLFDAATGRPHAALPGHGFGTAALSWHRDGRLLASAGQDGRVRLWDAAEGRQAAVLEGGAAWVEHVAWHPHCDLLASAAGRKLRLWAQDGQRVRDYPDRPATVADLCWRPGTDQLASATYGGVCLWEPDRDEPVRRFAWKGSVLALAWSPDGGFLAHGKPGRHGPLLGARERYRSCRWRATR